MSKPLKVFVNYSHKDTAAKDQLIKHLALMETQGLIDIWHDGELLPGAKWSKTIFSNLENSDILCYLVSAASLNSEICRMELVRSLSGRIKVIPIILENCDWVHHQLSGFEVLPYKGKPITCWKSESDAWQNVSNGIRKVVSVMRAQTEPSENIQAEQVFQRGHIRMMLGQIAEAIEAYSDALKLNPHHISAYANSISVDLLRQRERPFANVSTPVVLTEGWIDTHYIQTALTLLGEDELLKTLVIKPVGTMSSKGTHGGGKPGLDNVQKVYEVNSWLFNSPILLLYDCDTNKKEGDSEGLWTRLVPKNAENTKVKEGIENLFPESLFQDHFYNQHSKGDGGYLKLLDKNKFCKWICEGRKNPDDFVNFILIIDILKEFRNAH